VHEVTRDCEETLISDTEEKLFRQINPIHLQNGRVSSAVFVPRKTDNAKASVHIGSKIGTAKEAFNFYTGVLGFKSIGVLEVTYQIVQNEGLSAFHSPCSELLQDGTSISNSAHGHIDFSSCTSGSQIGKKAAKLRDYSFEVRLP
jgi:hypothetical protein